MWRRLPLPPIRDLGWDLKPLDSARTTITRRDAVTVHSIEHDTVHGVTPQMLDWWFRNMGGDVTIAGSTYARYLVWHPYDHIHWELVAGDPHHVAVGARFRIVEAFARNPDWYIDSVEAVDKLDATGIRLVRRIAGSQVLRLEHTFAAVDGGTRYDSELVIGNSNLFGRAFEPVRRRWLFTDDMGPAWLRHNVEEVGNLENFLPDLYRTATTSGVCDT